MQNKFVWSFLSLVTLAAGGLLGGCDSDAKIAKSAAGESCDKTSDCDDGLKCVEGTCYKKSSGTGGSSSNAGGEGNTAGTDVVGPKPPVLGGLGESCTKRADCEDGLACLNQRCSEDVAVGVGGEGSGGPALGGPGETCGLTSDCEDGLRCLPNGIYIDGIQATAVGSNSVGVCTVIDTDIEPTGKTCGAECVEAADCCEIPVAKQAALGAYSCADLAALVADVPNCDTAVGVNGAICLAYNSYCDDQCGKNTWACEAGRCQYTAKCTKATEVVGGCPAYTRGGHAISACDVKTSKCEPAVVAVTGCTTDASCATKALAVADGNGDLCSEGECACHVDSGLCYRMCSEDIDCPAHYSCDADTSLCVSVDACSTDLQCVVAYRDARATCNKGVCAPPPCEHDIDCNPYGLVNGQFTAVCSADNTCVPLAGDCTSDVECGPYTGTALAGNVRGFCADRTTVVTTPAPVSAITD
jgi:hypothetical protein